MATLPAILPQITITSSNKYVDIYYGASEKRCSVTEQDYDSIITLAAALQAAIRTTTTDATFTVNVSTTGTVTIARTGTFSILWLTGTDTASSMGTILGYTVTADDASAASYASDNQHMYGWYPEIAPESDSYDRPLLVGPSTVVGSSGRAQRITWATQAWREIKFAWIAADRFLDAYSDRNESFEEIWAEIAAGTPFEYYSDIAAPTNDGTYCLVCESNEDLIQGSPRVSPGDAYYERTLKLVKQNVLIPILFTAFTALALPQVVSASTTDNATVVLTYDMDMGATMAGTASCYAIDGGVTVDSVTVDSCTQVTLACTGITGGTTYTVTVTGVRADGFPYAPLDPDHDTASFASLYWYDMDLLYHYPTGAATMLRRTSNNPPDMPLLASAAAKTVAGHDGTPDAATDYMYDTVGGVKHYYISLIPGTTSWGPDEFAISGWYNKDLSFTRELISRSDMYGHWAFNITQWNFLVKYSDGTGDSITAAGQGAGPWRFFCASYKRNDHMAFYVDGYYRSRSPSKNLALYNDPANDVEIAFGTYWLDAYTTIVNRRIREGSGNSESLLGYMQDIRIFNRSLSKAEMDDLMAST